MITSVSYITNTTLVRNKKDILQLSAPMTLVSLSNCRTDYHYAKQPILIWRIDECRPEKTTVDIV